MLFNPWRNAEKVSYVAYCDMGFGGTSIILSIVTFMYALPLNREGNEFMHDFVTFTFMASLVLHFAQVFAGVLLVNGSEMQSDPHEAIKLCKYWQKWSIFLLLLQMAQLLYSFLLIQRTFLLAVNSLFISLEIPYRIYWRLGVSEFIQDLETAYPPKIGFRPYLWLK